ncbi:MAG: 4Fe-4S dicluster domain-containing protein, partial [Methanobrevibacter wolinii]
EEKRSPIEWALEYLWNMENVSCVFSGMNSLEHLKTNIKIASKSKPNMISKNDKKVIKDVAEEYRQHKGNDCTSCGYCMPCPNKINIPHCFREYNMGNILNSPKGSARQYFTYFEDEALAHHCTQCGDCVNMCPQGINIPEEMKKVEEYFGDKFNHF